ncbi:hypothetical protein QF049_006173 [Paenibacillus sp. W4I10]|uniref:hypothetical protein n=1 Tax=Paenibacillus sp. W4I10 TaxID=3042298 RepID=UPI00278A8F5B|nr:hypothetical protein [Paenibacillus sp. W4I10]MDQ0724912.1 hypothetical protein [Paenibacillus sp. W4I10]
MVILQYSYILASICLPIFLLMYNHPIRIIRWGTRGAILAVIFYLIAVVPFVILSQLKFWSILLIVIPIIFRIISLILTKIGFFSSGNEKMIENLLYACVSALSIIFVGASSNTLEKLFFLIIILLVLFLSDFQIIEKYKYMGALFGPIIAAIPSYDNFNVFFTVLAIWLVMTITLDFSLKILKIVKSKRIEKSTLIIFLTVSLIIANNGGLKLDWTQEFLRGLAFLVIMSLLLGSSFLINKKMKSEYLKHFLPVVISNSLLAFLVLMIEQFNGIKIFFSPFLIFIIGFCVFISLNRLISPLDKLTNSTSFAFNMNNISEMMNLVFGKKLGQALFNNIFGTDFRKIKTSVTLSFLLIYIIAILIALQLGYPTMKYAVIFHNEDIWLAVVTANSTFTALVVISEIIRISNSASLQNGLTKEEALHSSTVITLEYFVTFVPLLFILTKGFENVSSIILISVFLLVFYMNINMMLYHDLQRSQYNHFRKTRLVMAVFFQILSFASAPVVFFIEYKDQGMPFINQYNWVIFLWSLLTMFLAKLLGFDTELGSKRAYKQSWVKLIFLFISLNIVARFLPLIVYLIVHDESMAIYIAVLILLMSISIFGQEWAMVLLPWSNDSKKNIIQNWKEMIRNIKVENKVDLNRKQKGANRTRKEKK